MTDEHQSELFVSRGTVVTWWSAKGSGVVRPDNGDRDVWVHVLHIEQSQHRALAGGDRVEVAYRRVDHGPSGRWHGERVMVVQPDS